MSCRWHFDSFKRQLIFIFPKYNLKLRPPSASSFGELRRRVFHWAQTHSPCRNLSRMTFYELFKCSQNGQKKKWDSSPCQRIAFCVNDLAKVCNFKLDRHPSLLIRCPGNINGNWELQMPLHWLIHTYR